MSRHGYSDDWDGDIDQILANGRWTAQVNSAKRGRRGQALLRDLIAALDEMPEKRLIAGVLEQEGSVCALGAVCKKRGVAMPTFGEDDEADEWGEALGETLDIAPQLAQEVMYINDDEWMRYTPEARWLAVRKWAVRELELSESYAERKAARKSGAP